jgi:signal transduction histidine kinase
VKVDKKSINGNGDKKNSPNNQVKILQDRLEGLFHLTNDFALAKSESEIIHNLILQIQNQTQAIGVSFLPFDNLGQYQSTLSSDINVPKKNIQNWEIFITDPAITTQCKTCRKKQPVSTLCPLLSNPFSEFEHVHCFHLVNKKKRIGVVNVYLTDSISLHKDSNNYLKALTENATIFIENLRRQKEDCIKELLNHNPEHIITVNEKNKIILGERSRLAREIHDGLAQMLGFIKLQLSQIKGTINEGDAHQLAKSIDMCYMAVSEAYIDVREAIDDLHTTRENSDFIEWITLTLSEFETTFNISTKVTNFPLKFDIPQSLQIHLTRIIQEALSNIRKYAKPNLVEIIYQTTGDSKIILVKDDGIGFLIDKVKNPTKHGLRSMRERAKLINSSLDIISQPNEGTTIQIEIPVEMIR